MAPGKSATVKSYIAGFPPDVAAILERIRDAILENAPGATEAIKYDMPVFHLGKQHIFYLGAWKNHVAIYPVYPQAPALEKEVLPLRSGKDTVQFQYKSYIPYDLIARLVKARVKDIRSKAGEPPDLF